MTRWFSLLSAMANTHRCTVYCNSYYNRPVGWVSKIKPKLFYLQSNKIPLSLKMEGRLFYFSFPFSNVHQSVGPCILWTVKTRRGSIINKIWIFFILIFSVWNEEWDWVMCKISSVVLQMAWSTLFLILLTNHYVGVNITVNVPDYLLYTIYSTSYHLN